MQLRRADSFRTRLVGLAGRRVPPTDTGLLLTRTAAVHTFGMRFALDLVWLDAAARVVRVDESVPPQRFAACASACAVIETAAGGANRAGLRPGAIVVL